MGQVARDINNSVPDDVRIGGSYGFTGKRSAGRMEHSGTIRVEGVNDRGEFIEAVKLLIKDDLRMEARLA